MSTKTINDQEATKFVYAYLLEHPDFLCRYEELFARIHIPHQNREGTRSVIECQNEVLLKTLSEYEKLRMEEQKLASKHPSCVQLDKVITLAQRILGCRDEASLPFLCEEGMKNIFDAPYGVIRLWQVMPNFSFLTFARPVGAEVEKAIGQMKTPYCGPNDGDLIASWLEVPVEQTRGVLLYPLHLVYGGTFGFICLASPDPNHFNQAIENNLLKKAGGLVETALNRLTR